MKNFTLAILVGLAEASNYYPMYGHVHDVPQNGSYDPWATDPGAGAPQTSTWYSTTQQYSPPRIPFVPATHTGVIYAVCDFVSSTEFATGSGAKGNIQFAQRGGKATVVRINMTSSAGVGSSGASYAFRVHEFASIRGGGVNDCVNIGEEFNPLLEKDKMGRLNPYADPTRGRINDITLSTAGSLTDEVQKNVLVNLSGADSIIGRSIGLTASGLNADGTLATPARVDCCVIGFDETVPEAVTPHHHHYVGIGTTSTSSTGMYAPYTPYFVPVAQYTAKPTYVAPQPTYSYGSYTTTGYGY